MKTHRRHQTQPMPRRRAFRFGLPVLLLSLVAGCGSTSRSGTPALQAESATNQPTAAVGRAPSDPDPTVNGCLGGKPGIGPDGKYVDLDQIVLAAQKQAPLTPTGAAEFTATVARWTAEQPEPRTWEATVRQIVAPKADTVLQTLLKPADPKLTGGRLDFSTGGFSVESSDPTHAAVSWVADAYSTANGQDSAGTLADTFHLVAVDGVWRLANINAAHASVEEFRRTATPYNGGC